MSPDELHAVFARALALDSRTEVAAAMRLRKADYGRALSRSTAGALSRQLQQGARSAGLWVLAGPDGRVWASKNKPRV